MGCLLLCFSPGANAKSSSFVHVQEMTEVMTDPGRFDAKLWKTALCRRYFHNDPAPCLRGSRCAYAHDMTELQEPPRGHSKLRAEYFAAKAMQAAEEAAEVVAKCATSSSQFQKDL